MTRTTLVALLLLLPAACERPAHAAPRPTPSKATASLQTQPRRMPRIEAADVEGLVGRVEQVLRAGHYTYFQLVTDGEPRWVVVLGSPELTIGGYVDVAVYGFRQDFPSRRLQRQFDHLFFGHIRSTT